MIAKTNFDTGDYFFILLDNNIVNARVEKITITKLIGRDSCETNYSCNVGAKVFETKEEKMFKTKEDLILNLLEKNEIGKREILNKLLGDIE